MTQQPQAFLIRDLLRALDWFDRSLQNHLEAAGWPPTSRTKSMITIEISDGVTRPIQIAANLGLSRQAVHLALTELAQDGLVVLEPDPCDRRAKRVRFSDDPRGLAIRNDARRALRQVEAQLRKRLGTADFRSLCRSLRTDWGAPLKPDADD